MRIIIKSTILLRKRKTCTTYARDRILPLRLYVTAKIYTRMVALMFTDMDMNMDMAMPMTWPRVCCVQCNGRWLLINCWKSNHDFTRVCCVQCIGRWLLLMNECWESNHDFTSSNDLMSIWIHQVCRHRAETIFNTHRGTHVFPFFARK